VATEKNRRMGGIVTDYGTLRCGRMRPGKALAACICLIALLCDGCKQSPQSTTDYSAQIRALEAVDAEKDVTAAVASGDTRFVGVMGYGPIVPGAPEWVRLSRNVRFTSNTSDAIQSAQHARLQHVAYEYAKKYNEILLARVPSLATTRPVDQGASGSE
jgi:hypothetical protein